MKSHKTSINAKTARLSQHLALFFIHLLFLALIFAGIHQTVTEGGASFIASIFIFLFYLLLVGKTKEVLKNRAVSQVHIHDDYLELNYYTLRGKEKDIKLIKSDVLILNKKQKLPRGGLQRTIIIKNRKTKREYKLIEGFELWSSNKLDEIFEDFTKLKYSRRDYKPAF